MLILLAVFLGLAVSQTTPFTPVSQLTNNSAVNVKQATKGAGVSGYSGLTGDEGYYVYSADTDGAGGAVGRAVFSVPSGGTFNDVKQLSFVFAQSIGGWKFSPSQRLVTFTSNAQTGANLFQLFSVGTGGGTPTQLNPNVQGYAGNLLYTPRPCACSPGNAAEDGQILFTDVPSGGGGIKELWVNSINGGTPKKISIDLQQSASLPRTKFLNVINKNWNDWILYQANPGPNQGLDPSNLYIVDWFGSNTYQITPTTQNNITVTPSVLRSGKCFQNGQYIAFTTTGQSTNFASLYVYDLNAKQLLNGGAAINPALSIGDSVVPAVWSPDGTKLYFITSTGAVPQIDTLYEYDTAKPTTAAKQVNGAYVGTGRRTITIVPFTAGDYIFYEQNPVSQNSTNGVFSYNTKTGASPFNLISSSVIDGRQAYVVGTNAWAYPGSANGALDSNSARIVYIAQTGTAPNTFSLFSVPIAGGTITRINKPYTVGGTIGNVFTQICPGGAGGSSCSAKLPSCPSCTCSGGNGCSMYIVFTQPDADNSGKTTPYYALVDGAADNAVAIVTGTTFGLPTPAILKVWAVDGGAPLIALRINFDSNPAGLYLSRVTTAVTPASTRVNTAGAASQTNTTALVASTTDGNWIVFQSTTSLTPTATFPDRTSQTQLFAVKFDGTNLVRLNPALASTDDWFSTAQVTLSGDNKYFLFAIQRQLTGTPSTKTYLFSSTIGTNPTLINLTPIGLTGGDALSSIRFGNNAQIDCGNRALVYTASEPDSGDNTGVFSIALQGGETVRVSQNPPTIGVVQSFQISQAFFRVYFISNPTGTDDLFTNSAFAGMLMPSLAVLLLALLSLVTLF